MQKTYWADYLVAFRRREGLTQSELAARLGVKAPTISRWESGLHVPDLASQKALKAQIGVFDTNTEAEWIFRVGAANGCEFLISRERGLVATSRSGLATSDLKAFFKTAFIDGVLDLETGNTGQQPAALQAGLYDGSIRFLHFAIDSAVEEAPATFVVDVWPIVTTEQSAMAHICAHRQSTPSRGPVGATLKARNLTFISR